MTDSAGVVATRPRPATGRCVAGFDNHGACTEVGHGPWHEYGFADCAWPTYAYYDRCRRPAGHTADVDATHPEWHLPDCGSAVMCLDDCVVVDSSERWLQIHDDVVASGERLGGVW